MNKKLFWLITTALMAVLMFSGTVFAEGETPVAPTEEPVAVVVAAGQPAVEPAPVTPVVEEMPPADPAPTAEVISAAVEEPAAVVEAVPDVTTPVEEIIYTPVEEPAVIIDTAPIDSALVAGTDPAIGEAAIPEQPILADASGEPLNLASQESADLISSGDPYWFVGTKKYAVVFTGSPCPDGTSIASSTCWESLTSPINDALDRIESGHLLPTNRKLYIVGGTTYSENISINASSGADYYKGQLNGFIGIALSGVYPVLDGTIQLTGFLNGFTLSDFTVNGFSIKNSTGAVVVKNVKVHNTTGSGVVIGDYSGGVYTHHLGNVTLTNVISNGNTGSGAEIYAKGNTTITNSAFNFNGGYGLDMNTLAGTITVNNLTALGNQDNNVNIAQFQKTLTIKNAVLNDSQTGSGLYALSTSSAPATLDMVIANINQEYGIDLLTSGAIALSNIEANGTLNHTGVILTHIINGTPAIKVSKSRFINNGLAGVDGSGLEIYSLGPVVLSSITASGNQYDGLYVDNCLPFSGFCTGSGTVTLTSPADGGLAAANYFVGNHSNGIEIYSKSTVTLTNVESKTNDGDGVVIDNSLGTKSININTTLPYWTNTMSGNGNDGIDLGTLGYINLSNTSSTGNSGNGLFCSSNTKSIVLDSSVFNSNALSGINVTSLGTISLDKVTANDNQAYGMLLDNSISSTQKPVTIIKSKAFRNLNGIRVITKGSTIFTRVTASENTGFGAKVEGCLAGGCTSTAYFLMTSNVGNYFNDNGANGLSVETYGTISITNTSAINNIGYGLWLYNGYSGISNGVGITNNTYHSIAENTNGLFVITNGAITLKNVVSNANKVYGAYLDNSGAATAKALILNNSTFNSNEGMGLYTNIHGPIYGYGLMASFNSRHEGEISNGDIVHDRLTSDTFEDLWYLYGATAGDVITLSSSEFDGKFEVVDAATDAVLDIIDTFSGYTDESFTIPGGYSTDIYIRVTGLGAIGNYILDVNGTTDSYQDAYGAYLINTDGGVTLAYPGRFSQFNENNAGGLFIDSTGSVVLTDIKADLNSFDGAWIQSNSNVTVSGTHLTNATSFSGNEFNGLDIDALGTITLNKTILANSNGNTGIDLNNQTPGSAKTIRVNYTETNDNGSWGLWVQGNGIVNLTGIESQRNANDGVYVENNSGVSGIVTVSGTNLLSNNGSNGLEIDTPLAASVNGVTANSNGLSGIYITSLLGTTKVSNSITLQNLLNGIEINAVNNVLITGLKSLSNGTSVTHGDGLWIDSNGYNVTIKSSLFMGNYGNGIDVQLGGGAWSLSSTVNFGNDANNDGYADLLLTP